MPVASGQAVLGYPGLRSVSTAEYRRIFTSASPAYVPGGRSINGLKARDPGNTPFTDALRAGLLMGKRTANGYFANAIIGTTTGALAAGGTSITISAASAVELVRRVGATGNLVLTGPSSANGTDTRQVTTAYSAVNTLTGVVTITAPTNANQVDRSQFNAASTAGNLQLTVQKPDGTFVTTGNAAWNATDATYLAAINTALDTATGVVGGIVASAIPATDTDLGIRLTYSGVGYAGQDLDQGPRGRVPDQLHRANYFQVTAPTNGAFIAGSWVGDTDGSQLPADHAPGRDADPGGRHGQHRRGEPPPVPAGPMIGPRGRHPGGGLPDRRRVQGLAASSSSCSTAATQVHRSRTGCETRRPPAEVPCRRGPAVSEGRGTPGGPADERTKLWRP
jgi:hypothetical protein